MANSGIFWVDYIFDMSVRGLFTWAKFMGITYEEINVWLFCIAWPLLTIIQTLAIFYLWHRLRITQPTIRRPISVN
jgi:hypothetical protein